MIKVLITISLLLTSCSTLPRMIHKKKGIDPTFKPYIEEYRNMIGKDKYDWKFKRLSVNFVDLERPAIGRCWWLINGGYEIEIDRVWWTFSSQISKRFTMYHELEHCIRFRMHTDRKTEIDSIGDFFDEIGYLLGIIPKPGYLKDGCPASIMNSYSIAESCQEKHYNHYIDEIINLK